FVVNDYREAGTYGGQHGMVLENGLPSTGSVTVNRARGHVYDLVTEKEVPATAGKGKLSWTVNLAPCDGGVFLAMPEAIGSVKLKAPHSLPRGAKVELAVSINDTSGKFI